jgi:hypothetical protein
LDFYKINFGLDTQIIWGDSQIIKDNQKIEISGDNFSSINKILIEENPINRNKLSKKNLNTIILRNLEKAQYNSFEIVVADDKSSIEDLSYFWNRHLFQCSNIIYCTLEEFNILMEDEYFLRLISNMKFDTPVEIVSRSIEEKEIKELIEDKIEKKSKKIRHLHSIYKYKKIDEFPFEILDSNGLFEREYGENSSTQTLISDKGLYHIPNLSFTESVEYFPQKWAIDIDIKSSDKDHLNSIQLPYTTDSSLFFRSIDSRINKNKSFSIFIHNQKNKADSIAISIPSFFNLTSQLIVRPNFQGEYRNTKYVTIGYHDDSYRLISFIKLFNWNLSEIEDFFTDKFWVDIYEELCTSNESAGDTISFKSLLDNCMEVLKKNKIKLGEKKNTHLNKENLEIGLKETLSRLNQLQIF